MRWRRSGPNPASAGSISSFSSATASVLQLDDDLAVRLAADIAGCLHAAAADEHGHAGDHLSLQIVLVGTLGVGLGDHRHAVAAELDQQMVELMAVRRAVLAGCQPELPRLHALVLEQQPSADASKDPFSHRGESLSSRRMDLLIGDVFRNAARA